MQGWGGGEMGRVPGIVTWMMLRSSTPAAVFTTGSGTLTVFITVFDKLVLPYKTHDFKALTPKGLESHFAL